MAYCAMVASFASSMVTRTLTAVDPRTAIRGHVRQKERWPRGRRNPLKRLDSRKERGWILLPLAWIFLPLAWILLPQGLDFRSLRLGFSFRRFWKTGARLDDHERLGEARLVGEGQVDGRLGSRRQDRSQSLCGAAGQAHGRLAGRKIDHPHVAPEHPAPEPGPQGLGAGLLGGESLGVGGGAPGPPLGAALLGLGEAAGDEALSESRERPLDALDVTEVAADPDDHRRPSAAARPSSIAARMVFMVSASPTKIASPTRKWPMLSSTICGKAAMRRAVS